MGKGATNASPKRPTLSSERASELARIAWSHYPAGGEARRLRCLKMRLGAGLRAQRELDELQRGACLEGEPR